MNWRWHLETVQYRAKAVRCAVFGHRRVVLTPHYDPCANYPPHDECDEASCTYCETWL